MAGPSVNDVVTSSAGATGEANKVQVLTEARATVVRDYFVQHFKVDDTRIRTIGFGKTSTDDDARSVKVLVYPVGVNAPPQTAGPGNKPETPGAR